VFAEEDHALGVAVIGEHLVEVEADGVGDFVEGELAAFLTAEYPGVADGGSADHDGVAAGVVEHFVNVGRFLDVAAADDGDADGLF
jgi:hypothetical protein